jgi:hypothetical protein
MNIRCSFPQCLSHDAKALHRTRMPRGVAFSLDAHMAPTLLAARRVGQFGLLWILLPVIGACYGVRVSEPREVPVDEVFSLSSSSTRAVDGGRLTLRFDSVEVDTRCEANLLCDVPGDARVRATIRDVAGTVVTLRLHTFATPRDGEGLRASVRLDSLLPHPALPGTTIQHSQYVAFFTVRAIPASQ